MAFRPRAIDGRVTPADADLIFESIAVDREEQLVGGVVPAQGLCGTRVYLALPDLQPKMQCHLVVHNVGVVDVRASLFLLDSSEEHRLLCRPRRTLPFRCPVCTEPMVVLWPSPVLIGDFGSDAGVRIVHARESASCKLAVDRNLLTELDDRICERDAGAADKDPTWKTKSDDTLARARQHLVRKTA